MVRWNFLLKYDNDKKQATLKDAFLTEQALKDYINSVNAYVKDYRS